MGYPKGRKRCTRIYPKLLEPTPTPSYGIQIINVDIGDSIVPAKCRAMAVEGTEFCQKHQPASG